MTTDADDHRDVTRIVDAALRAEAPDTVWLPSDGWSLSLANGSPARVRARIAGGEWLELVTSIKDASVDEAGGGWPLLAINAKLAGTARLAAAPDAGLQLRADTFVGIDVERFDRERQEGETSAPHARLAEVVRCLCDDFRAALHRLHDGCDGALDAVALAPEWPPSSATSGGGPRLSALCAEAGWPAAERASGDLIVTIDASRTTYQAHVALGADGSLRALVPFADLHEVGACCRTAITRLLMRTAATVRLVKGVLVRRGDGVRPGLAAASGPPCCAADVGRVLEALTVGCAIAGREALALADEHLARAYISLDRAGLPAPEAERAVHERTTEEERTCLQQP